VSVQAIEWVLKHSRAAYSARLVLIVLAHHADDDGRDSYPSIGTIAREAGLGESTIRGALERLKALGEIVETGLGPRRTRSFQVLLDPAGSAASTTPAGSAAPQD
jgi:DNA-binding transcriptional regulator PaaX